MSQGWNLCLSEPKYLLQATGSKKLIKVEYYCNPYKFYEKCMVTEVVADELKGFVVQNSGGNDKEYFPMK